MFWKISDFTEEIKRAVGDKKLNRKTVATWFNKLEEKGIHYINRTEDTNEKVYDELDLKIGIFIKKKRQENWSLNAIFNEIYDRFDVRPAPSGQQNNGLVQNGPGGIHPVVLQQLKKELLAEIRSVYEEVAAGQLKELKDYYKNIARFYLKKENNADEREKRFQEMVLKRRVEYQLEREAILLWAAKPADERLKKAGWFRKEEDIMKRDLFIKDYINRHFAERLKRELGFDEVLQEEQKLSLPS